MAITPDERRDHTAVEVASIPLCDINKSHGPAYADAALPAYGGSWGYVCKADFDQAGASLGLGRGQRLVERDG